MTTAYPHGPCRGWGVSDHINYFVFSYPIWRWLPRGSCIRQISGPTTLMNWEELELETVKGD